VFWGIRKPLLRGELLRVPLASTRRCAPVLRYPSCEEVRYVFAFRSHALPLRNATAIVYRFAVGFAIRYLLDHSAQYSVVFYNVIRSRKVNHARAGSTLPGSSLTRGKAVNRGEL
jgi:hypothetical protein